LHFGIKHHPEIALKRRYLERKRIAIPTQNWHLMGKAAKEKPTQFILSGTTLKKQIVQGENIGQTYQFVVFAKC